MSITFKNVTELKKYIYELNNSIFDGVQYGLYWRGDNAENISLRMKNRYAQRAKVGLNIDFDLMKNDLNIKSENLSINIIVRNIDLLEEIKSKLELKIEQPYKIRNRYLSTKLETNYYADILIKNLDELKKILELSSNFLFLFNKLKK